MYNPNLIIRNIRQKLTVGILPKEKKKKKTVIFIKAMKSRKDLNCFLEKITLCKGSQLFAT